MTKMPRFFVATLAVLLINSGSNLNADILYGGGTYTQNFNSLITTGAGQVWANNSTLAGWSLFQAAGAPITSYSAGSGTSATGSYYSFGTGTNTDRSLGSVGSGGAYFGSPASGAPAGYSAVQITNNTGLAINSFTIGFDGEQWRNAGNTTPQTMFLQYGFGSTFGSVAFWNSPGGNFDWTSIVNTATAAAVDGNTTGLVAGLGGTISSLTWNNGDSLWIRWVETNDVGSDHGLGIDNFSFSATNVAIPEPGAVGLVSLAAFGAMCLVRRRRV